MHMILSREPSGALGRAECVEKSALGVTLGSLQYSDIKREKKKKQPRDLISDSQAELTSGIVLPGHNRLILLSCLQNQQKFGTFL